MTVRQNSEAESTNILFIDETLQSLNILEKILTQWGYNVSTVKKSDINKQPDKYEKSDLLIFSIKDYVGGNLAELEMLQTNKFFSEIPVVFVGIANTVEEKISAFEAGAIDYISIPFDEREIIARIKAHLRVAGQNRQLKLLSKEKDKFFSIIAHNLKGPIGNLKIISEALAEDKQMDEESFNMLIELQKETSKDAMNLLENLLVWARVRMNQIENRAEKTNIGSLIPVILEKFQTQLESKDLTISVEVKSPAFVDVDSCILKIVMGNFISNAIKYTPNGGKIFITSKVVDSFFVIEVKDLGVGMKPKQINDLYKIDVNSSTSGTDGETGSGLGLIICKELTDLIGGKIEIDSTFGNGSTFSVYFP